MKVIFNIDDTLYTDPIFRIERDLAIQRILGQSVKRYREYRKRFTELQALVMLGVDRKEYNRSLSNLRFNLHLDPRLRRILESIPFKKVIITNNPYPFAMEIIQKLGVSDLFNAIYAEEDKPSKEAFGIIEPMDLCVGSSFEKDLAIPKKMGAVTVLIGEDSRAHHNLKSIYELDRLISSSWSPALS